MSFYEKEITSIQRNNKLVLGFVILIVLVLGLVEWKFFFVEKALGQYLVWNNESREKLGPQWQRVAEKINADRNFQRLDSLSRKARQDVDAIQDFGQLLGRTAERGQIVLQPRQFQRLYSRLPFHIKTLIIEPDSLLIFAGEGLLSDVFCTSFSSSLALYFVDSRNNLLSQTTLTAEEIEMIGRHGSLTALNLEADSRFPRQRIFSLARFNQKMKFLDYETKEGFLRELPAMTEFADNASVQIAISNKIISGLVEMAVAIDRSRAYLYYLPEDWINDFGSLLDDEDFSEDEDEIIL